jgi:hypothetical protein
VAIAVALAVATLFVPWFGARVALLTLLAVALVVWVMMHPR